MAAAKKSTVSKEAKKKATQAAFKAGIKSGKIKPLEAGLTGAMVAKAAGKVISKVASKASSASRANARGLKAANKPTNRTGSTADRQLRADLGNNQANMIKNSDPARPNRVRGGSLNSMKTYGGVGDVAAAAKKSPSAKIVKRQREISKELNPVRKKKSK
jgi:hypothetical protein